ncbi:MAG: hypothetical protein H0U74_02690 [Bradymonadaceae bacterium]|nr:hypothetical protein [Lujinxingiaceae bacterium]
MKSLFALIIASLLVLAGCDSAPKEAALEAEPPAAAQQEAPKEQAGAPAELAMAVLTADGQTFDPALQVAQIPAGAWYCDMGTVHYARLEEGDGTCPACKMKLVQRAAMPAAGHNHDHDHDHDHDHAH